MSRWKKAGCLVFDSWALLAFLLEQSGAAETEKLIGDALDANARMLVTSVNMGEVWYSLARRLDAQRADAKVAELTRMGLEIVEVDWSLTRMAAALKVGRRLSYADCFAAALTQREDSSLLTGDREFEQLTDEIEIIWLGR